MKVVAVKGIEKHGNLWAIPYAYLKANGGKWGGMFLCTTPEEAKAKYQELLDIVEHHDGVYIGATDNREYYREYRKQYYIKKQLGEI